MSERSGPGLPGEVAVGAGMPAPGPEEVTGKVTDESGIAATAFGEDGPAPVVIAWSDVPSEEAGPGVRRQVIHGGRQTMIRYVYSPGAVFANHAHPQEQVTVVLRGRIAFEIAGRDGRLDRVEMGPGQVAVIPGGVAHGAAVVGDEVVETMNTLSPRRDLAPGAARPDHAPPAAAQETSR